MPVAGSGSEQDAQVRQYFDRRGDLAQLQASDLGERPAKELSKPMLSEPMVHAARNDRYRQSRELPQFAPTRPGKPESERVISATISSLVFSSLTFTACT